MVSETYMLMSYYLNKNSRRDPKLTAAEELSLRLKKNLFYVNVVSIVLASYFFVRHNDHCEGGGELNHPFVCKVRTSVSFATNQKLPQVHFKSKNIAGYPDLLNKHSSFPDNSFSIS